MRRFVSRLASLFRKSTAERDMQREVESHLALIQEEFERRGYSPEASKQAALRAYGGVEQAKERHRETRSFLWIEQLLKDVRYGARNLARAPGFTLIAVMTLALAIGANTAMFSVINAVLLRPLTYKDPDRLVTILHYGTNPVATANYFDWRNASRSFQAMGAADAWGPNLTNVDSPENLHGMKVTQNLFPMLGVQPLLGRLFLEGEDAEGSGHTVILSYGFWGRHFNRDPHVLGRSITLDGEAYTVVGVMPEGFRFSPFWVTRAELWVPDVLGASASERGGNHLRVFARLKDGVTLTQARAEMSAITARLERQYPATNRFVEVTPLRKNVVGNIETPLLVSLAAVGFVLLIACANVAHMLLARTADRQRELAVRTALGAGRARVMALLLTENILLAALGAAAGLQLAFAGTKALVWLRPAYLPRIENVSIDSHVVLFLLCVTVATSLLFGLAPAMHAAAGNLSDALKDGTRGDSEGRGRGRLRSFLVSTEFALAFMLLIGAGLMIRTFIALQSASPGFNPSNVISMVVSVAGTNEADEGRRELFYRKLPQHIEQLPGVQSASGINHLPLAGDTWGRSFEIEGRPKPRPGEFPGGVYRIILPGYFKTMQIPLRRGRDVTAHDDRRAPGVVVINERAARQYWSGANPLGQRIKLDDDAKGQPLWLTIIGVVADAKQSDWASEPGPEIYLAALQVPAFLGDNSDGIAPHMAYLTLVVRSAGYPASQVAAIKQSVWSLDRNLPISEVATMDHVVAEANAQPRFLMFLLVAFGVVALVLAAVGIYGVMNYSVSRRTREIGIRISLGATRAEVLRMVVRQGMLQAIVGAMVGIAGSLLLARLMEKMLYGVRPSDPLTFAGVVVVLASAALLATCIPGRRATRIEPMVALRSE